MFFTKKKAEKIGKMAGEIAGQIATEKVVQSVADFLQLQMVGIAQTFVKNSVEEAIAPIIKKIDEFEIAMLDIPLLKQQINNIPTLLQELRAMITCLDKEHAKEMHGLFNDIGGKIIDASKDVDKFHIRIKEHVSSDVTCARLQIESLHKIVCEKFDDLFQNIDESKFHEMRKNLEEQVEQVAVKTQAQKPKGRPKGSSKGKSKKRKS